MNEAESRKKEVTTGTFTIKKVKTLPDEAIALNLEAESAGALKLDYGLAARFVQVTDCSARYGHQRG